MKEDAAGQQRTCIACRGVLCKNNLIRLTVVEGQVVADLFEKLGGRGVYACPERQCLITAMKDERLSRGFKRKVSAQAPDEIIFTVSSLLKDRIISLLRMAQKAGEIAIGASAVSECATEKDAAIVILAADVSGKSVEKMLRPHSLGPVKEFVFLDKDALGAVFGRESIGVIAIRQGGLARSIARELARHESLANSGGERL